MTRRMRIVSHVAGFGLFATCLSAGALAQRQPVVFQHGFLSDPTAWDVTASHVSTRYYATPYAFDTYWERHLAEQGTILDSRMRSLSLPDTSIIIGHSNGGLVARSASRLHRFKALVTIGTLHQGAQLARSLLDGLITDFGQFIAEPATFAADAYAGFGDGGGADWWHMESISAARAQEVVGYAIPAIGFFVQGMQSGGGVLGDMVPGSAFLASLNNADALGAESSRFPYQGRLGVQSVLDFSSSDYVIWRALTPSIAHDNSVGADLVVGTEMFAYFYYSMYWSDIDAYSYMKQYYAPTWLIAALRFDNIDVDWCGLIGAANGLYCTQSDGIVPYQSQVYPDPNGTALNRVISGPGHLTEKTSQKFCDELDRFLDRQVVTTGSSGTHCDGAGGGGAGGGDITVGGSAGAGEGGTTCIDPSTCAFLRQLESTVARRYPAPSSAIGGAIKR